MDQMNGGSRQDQKEVNGKVDHDLSAEREMGNLRKAIDGFGKSLSIFNKTFDELGASLVETKDSIYELKDKIKKQEEDEANIIAKMNASTDEEEKAALADLLAKIRADSEADREDLKKKEEEWAKKKREEREENLDKMMSKAGSMLADTLSKFTKSVESVMDKFLATQESMSYNLEGTGRTLDNVSDKLNDAINGKGIVKTEQVYGKLNELLKSGIVYNAEQRAYLAQLSEDVGLNFNVQSANLTRLVDLQRQDLTANRIAIADSLKEFLNQNYETSQYIKEGFNSVSEALLEAQSFMGIRAALDLEETIQKWLGSLASVGLSSNTYSGLAKALGELGSGNLSALSGDKLQTLIILGASRSGDDYAKMLTQGLTADEADSLLGGIVTYLTEVAGRESNVVKSAFADMLGISFSDLRAITNFGLSNKEAISGLNLSTDPEGFLRKVSRSLYDVTQLQNVFENLQWAAGSDIASSSGKYMTYKIIDLVSSMAGQILNGTTATIGFLGNGVQLDLGKIAGMIPTITLAGMSLPSIIKGIGNFSLSDNAAYAIFQDLGVGKKMRTGAMTGDITGLSRSSGRSNSGSLMLSEAGESEVIEEAKTSGTKTGEQMYDEEDKSVTQKIFELVGGDDVNTTVIEQLVEIRKTLDELPNRTWFTVSEAGTSSVTIGINGDTVYGNDLLNYTALSYLKLANIQEILWAIQQRSEDVTTYTNEFEADMLSRAVDIPNFLSGG